VDALDASSSKTVTGESSDAHGRVSVALARFDSGSPDRGTDRAGFTEGRKSESGSAGLSTGGPANGIVRDRHFCRRSTMPAVVHSVFSIGEDFRLDLAVKHRVKPVRAPARF
jgi:hypothetical protein